MTKKGENITRRKDGRYEGRYIKDRDENGKIIYGYVYARKYQDVRKKQIEAIKNIEQSEKNEKIEKEKFNTVIDSFLQSKKDKIKESTLARYVELSDKHIRPYFGSMLNTKITIEYAEKVNKTKYNYLSGKTNKDLLLLLNQMFKYGNIPIKLDYPTIEKKPIEVLTVEEQIDIETEILKKVNGIGVAILLSLYQGLRIGEVCALKWKNVNLEKKYIEVVGTVIRIKNLSVDNDKSSKTKLTIQNPKTNNSVRKIPINETILEYLKKHKSMCNDEESFVVSNSRKISEPRVIRNKYHVILRKLRINSTFHGLRHTFATRCVDKGVDIKTLSEILGHKSVKTTLELYVHPSMETKRRMINKVAFKKNKQSNKQSPHS